MTVTCCIRNRIKAFGADGFADYARNWLTIVPGCGGDLHGSSPPQEGMSDVALAMISFASLAGYEADRTRLGTDEAETADVRVAYGTRSILSRERTALEPVRAGGTAA